MEKSRLTYLFAQYTEGSIKEDEKYELMSYIDHIGDYSLVEECMDESWERGTDEIEIGEDAADRIFIDVIGTSVDLGQSRANRPNYQFFVRVAAAATLFFVLGLGYYSYQLKHSGKAHVVVSGDVDPGKDVAILTLSDGKKVALSPSIDQKGHSYGNILISRSSDGTIQYRVLEQKGQTEVVYNEISTPNGGQIHIDLPDGSKVWLNAASRLKIPSDLTENRVVELTGEAYFEVFHNPDKPFIVKSEGQQVKVLGTHFNIKAYPDEKEIKTTLLSGSVRVNSNLLKPGEQSIFREGQIRIVDADLDSEMGWKNGVFVFDGKDFTTIAGELERWYDVKIEFDSDIEKIHFGGQISRNRKLSRVLKTLEGTGDVRSKIEGRRVVIMK